MIHQSSFFSFSLLLFIEGGNGWRKSSLLFVLEHFLLVVLGAVRVRDTITIVKASPFYTLV